MIIYKIRRKDGLFSMGGSTPLFNKTGKIWKQKNHLTSHLNQLRWGHGCRDDRHVYHNCEIVPYELVEQPAGPGVSISQYKKEIEQRKKDREEAGRKQQEKWQKDQRRKQFEELMKEFG